MVDFKIACDIKKKKKKNQIKGVCTRYTQSIALNIPKKAVSSTTKILSIHLYLPMSRRSILNFLYVFLFEILNLHFKC